MKLYICETTGTSQERIGMVMVAGDKMRLPYMHGDLSFSVIDIPETAEPEYNADDDLTP